VCIAILATLALVQGKTLRRWLHEVKFDGWCAQVQKYGRLVRLMTRGGYDWYDATRRFCGLAEALTRVPARFCIIDGEVTACDAHGIPKFDALYYLGRR
jgi:bifunctional non-homologous end joining protein LigD